MAADDRILKLSQRFTQLRGDKSWWLTFLDHPVFYNAVSKRIQKQAYTRLHEMLDHIKM